MKTNGDLSRCLNGKAVRTRSFGAALAHSLGCGLGCFLVALCCGTARSQTLTNGALYSGSISAGATNSYTLTVHSGDSLVVRVAELTATGYFDPWLRLYGPDGALIGSVDPGAGLAGEIALTATNSGACTVTVCDGAYAGFTGTGTYQLNFFAAPESFVVSPGDEGGTLTNGALNVGTISAGDLDVWSFTATNGESLVLRVAELTATGYFDPWLRLYGPDGALLASVDSGSGLACEIALTATNNGLFTVVVSDGAYSDLAGTGTYQLNLFKAPEPFVVSPGDEGGPLANGALVTGTISAGDLDVWSFTANAGDSLAVRVGTLSALGYFDPWLRLYGPDGALVGTADSLSGVASEIALRATNSGTFTVVVSDGTYSGVGGTGTYQLNYLKAPGGFVVSAGDEGGVLTNGSLSAGTISAGDLDGWSFTASAGDSVLLRVGLLTAVDYFDPWLRVYGPDGALVGTADSGSGAASEVALSVTNTGTFTVLVSDGTYGGLGGTGTYDLSYFKAPGAFVVSAGDEGGTLTNGMLNLGTITAGDLDVWTFSANAGDSAVVRIGALTSAGYFDPWLRVYGPNGALLGSVDPASGADAEFALTATNSGTFSVVVSDGAYGSDSGTGTYELSLAHAPGDVFVSPGDEGGLMANGVVYTGTNSLGDLDVWSFYGTTGDSNVFRIATTNFTPRLRLYGPSGALVGQAFTANSGNRTNYLSFVVTNSGNYTLVSSAYYLDQSGTYSLKQSRVPPDLIVQGAETIDESATLNLSLSAQDPDVPDKTLSFALISGPPGMNLIAGGPTNATLVWTTTEASGPSTNLVVVSVTDQVNSTAFTRTNSFNVVVNEINQAPSLTLPATQTFDELTTLNVFASATDPDIPANTLTFSLVSGPPGLTLDATSGAISWTPTEAQGPSTNLVTVAVTDDNPWAINQRNLSVTNSFTVVVREINVAPQLTVPATQTIDELTSLNVSASATDADLPANTLTFSLVSPPPGMTINSASGAISWMPTEAQGPSGNLITVVVTDYNPYAANAQHLSTTNTFTVNVQEVNTAPQLTVPPDQTIDELTTLAVSASATDSDLPANPLTFSLISAPSGMTINSASGAISWMPTEAQGPSTNLVTVVVTDYNATAINAQHLSATNSFTVTVREVNTAPQLTVPADQTIDELTTLSVSASATDSDLPPNPLTFTLLSPPPGMTINPNSGAISWTPTEAQGPSTNLVTVVVTDTNSAALFNRQLSATNAFHVFVREVNVAPVLQAITNRSIHFGLLLSVQAVASDSDLPINTLTFSLDVAPTNMSVNPSSGLISWTPLQTQVGTTLITVRVTDNGTPPLSATQSFQVTVTGNGSSLTIVPLSGGLKQLNLSGDTGLTYEVQTSTNLVNWDNLIQINLSSSPYPYIDPSSATLPKRFYRMKLTQ